MAARGERSSSRSRRRAAVEGEEDRRIANLGPRLVRASHNFSSTDTIRTVQNIIADRSGVWPVLQVVWLCWSEALATSLGLPAHTRHRPVHLTEDHLSMSLGALRVRPGDTIYYQATVIPEAQPVPAPSIYMARGQKIRKALKAKKILKKAMLPKTTSIKKMKLQTGRMVELHVTEGSRLGSQLVYPADDTGYVYRVKRIKKNTIYFSCGYTGCRACGNFKKKGETMYGLFDLTSHHNHKRNPTHLRRLKFESICKKRNLEEDVPAAQIIKEELDRWQLREDDVSLNTLNSTLYKARWRLAVDDPSSVPDVNQQLPQHQHMLFPTKLDKVLKQPQPLGVTLEPPPTHQQATPPMPPHWRLNHVTAVAMPPPGP